MGLTLFTISILFHILRSADVGKTLKMNQNYRTKRGMTFSSHCKVLERESVQKPNKQLGLKIWFRCLYQFFSFIYIRKKPCL